MEFREESVSNVIYEDSASFGRSVSNEAYHRAFQITQTILSINNRYQEKGKKDGTAIRNSGQFFNIIAFTGGRGTGKTSVMLSYMEFLKDYYRNAHSRDVDEKLGDMRFQSRDGEWVRELMFTGLEHIDASLLGSRSDDVLRNILPKMLKKWHDEERRSYRDSGIVRDEDYAYKKRHIQMLFNNVYKSLRDLNKKEDILESDNDMFMETLENLSLTWNLRQSFQELVEAYLEIMEYPGSEGKIHLNNHFLVISLDDLDMNMAHGYELLEEVRKYLMVPNVIVLLTASYTQLERLCVEHYAKAFQYTERKMGAQEYIENLAGEYLEKILPYHCQVPMEPVLNWKIYDQEKISLKYTPIHGPEQSPAPETVRKIIQNQLADYLGLKFSGDGVCLTWLVPHTIRELAVWVRQVYSLEKTDYSLEDMRGVAGTGADGAEHGEGACEEENAERTGNSQKAGGYSGSRNRKWFLKNKLLPLYERHSDWDTEYIDRLEPMGQIQTISGLLSKNTVTGNAAAVGEASLLENLRECLNGTRQMQERAALSVIYLTVKLTELFAEWYCGDGDMQRTQAVHLIKQYFHDGIWGAWEDKLISSGIMDNDQMFCRIGRIKFAVLNQCLDHIFGKEFSPNNTKQKMDFIQRNQETIRNYQLLLLFFDFSVDFTFSKSKLCTEEGNYRFVLDIKRCRGQFALSHILRPWEDKSRVLDDFQKAFLQSLGLGKNGQENEKVLDCIDIRRFGNGYIVIPAENVEYLIRTGQKLESKFKDNMINMDEAQILEKIVEYFAVIQDSLREYDDMFATCYEETFAGTQIGRELRKAVRGEALQEGDLLHMLSVTIARVAVPWTASLLD